MRTVCGSLVFVALLAAFGSGQSPATAPGGVAEVLTQHNDTDRTGWNPHEAALTPAAVAGGMFGKLFDLEVDGLIYAQPLVVTGVDIDGARHDVVVVATAHNSVYAFDADSGARLWQENYGPAIPTPNRFWNTAWGVYLDLTPELGIISTPVVDRETMTIYFTTATWQAPRQVESRRARIWENDAEAPIVNYYLHAVDLRTHLERAGAPVRIEGSVPLLSSHTGRHAGAARLTFNPMQHLQRPGLLLVKGRVVLGFGGHADQVPYQGWVFAYDTRDLAAPPWTWSSMAGGAVTQVNGSGIWQAGMGLTADAAGNVYLVTGNGDFDPSAAQFGDSVVKLSLDGGLTATDSFTPCNQACLDATDGDLGSSGLLHVPGTHLVLLGGKLGRIFVLNMNRLGTFTPPPAARCSTACSDPRVFSCPNPNVVQEFQAGCDVTGNEATIAPVTPCSAPMHQGTAPPGKCPPLVYQLVGHHIHGAPVYWRGDRRGAAIYVWTENDVLRAFPFDAASGRFSGTGCAARPASLAWTVGRQLSPGALHYGMTGGMLSISSNAATGGIVWATTPTNNDANQRIVPGILRAYDANDLRHELWNSYQRRDRDDFGNFAKHAPPTVANGKVYVATFSRHLSVYGLHAPDVDAAPAPLLANGDFEEGTSGWTFDGPGTVSEAFPYWGTHGATLCPLPTRDVRLWQEIQAPATGTYLLSAMLATDIRDGNVQHAGGQVTLGADVDGVRAGDSRDVLAFAGYQRHRVRFDATRGSRIRVWYYAPAAAPLPYFGITPPDAQPEAYAVIDGVVLTPPR